MKNVNDILAEISAAAEQRGHTLVVARLDDATAAGESARGRHAARQEARSLGALTFGAGDAPPLPSEQRDLDRLHAWAER